ncbi:ATP-binding protein [bacterium]|nr:ATP-binding protein [bacterium]
MEGKQGLRVVVKEELEVKLIPGHEHVVRILLTQSGQGHEVVQALQKTLRTCLKDGKRNFIVDLKDVRYPSASLIAALIAATSKVRRLNGELKLVNVSRSAKNNLATFSPLSYLSVEKDETFALQDFGIPEKQENDMEVDTDDIVEDPLIERLDQSCEEEVGERYYQVSEEILTEELTPKNYGAEPENHLRVNSDPKNLYTICDFVTGFADEAGFSAKDIGKMKIAVYEACLNIIEHAYHSNPENWIDVWADFDNEKLTIIVRDYGKGFEGLNIQDYNVLTAMDHRQTGGFGLYIIRRSMDEVEYTSDEGRGNKLRMVKYLNSH